AQEQASDVGRANAGDTATLVENLVPEMAAAGLTPADLALICREVTDPADWLRPGSDLRQLCGLAEERRRHRREQRRLQELRGTWRSLCGTYVRRNLIFFLLWHLRNGEVPFQQLIAPLRL